MYSHYRKIITSLLILILIFNLPLVVFASKLYTDVSPGHWAEFAADVMGQKNIMKGISTTEFGGGKPIKRYDVAEIINGLMGNRTFPPMYILLADVSSGNPYFKVVMNVLSINLMEPQGNKFNGEKKVSRYDFAKFMVNTLNYSQADPISTRQNPIAVTNVTDDKKAIVDKTINFWQLTEGYNDWGKDISRYEALEMVARAAMNLDPEIISSIGTVARPVNPIETPVSPISTPFSPTPTPEPRRTPVVSSSTPTPEPRKTPVVSSPRPTPEPERTPVVSSSTPEPERTPVISSSTPEPERTPVISSSLPTPEPERTPVVSSPVPTPEPERTPVVSTSTPTPVQTHTPSNGNFIPVLRNQLILKGGYNFLYSESLPSIFINETIRNYDDILGLAIGADISYWFKDFNVDVIKDTGLIFKLSTMGFYLYPIPTALNPTAKPDTQISESFKGDLSLLYKVYKSQDFELAAGLDTYYRSTSRNSGVPVNTNNSYWRTSKNYFGIGAKGLVGWRVTDRIALEGSFSGHYVAQTLNEAITQASGTPIPANSVLDRFDVEFGLDARMDLIQIGSNWLFVNVNLESRILLGDGNQTIVGGGLGAGINF